MKNLSSLSLLIGLALAATVGRAVNTKPAARPPNVLFIAIDDLNDWGVAALNGRAGVHTPNLDRLAARGVLFTNASCAAPACNPSRTSILSGLAPYHSGVYSNGDDWRANPRIKGAVPTLPEYFRHLGYRVVGGGKIFHALEWIDGPSDGYNDPACWDEFFPSVDHQIPARIYPADMPVVKGHGPRPIPPFDWSPLAEPIEKWPDHKVIDWAIRELNTPHTQPRFQAVGLFRPHIPWYVPQRFYDLYPLDQVELPYVKQGWLENLPPSSEQSGAIRRKWHWWVVENQQWRKAVQGYLAAISFADYELGRLLDALDASPEKDNTIVVLWTDHGFHLGDKETWEKFTLWAEATRVPLMVVAPGVTKPNSRSAAPVSLLDLYPTLVELAGQPPTGQNDGISLVPWLKDPSAPRQQPAIVTNERGNHAVRTDRWHYIRYANGDEELYDIQADEGQWHNLATDPAHVKTKAELAAWLPKEEAAQQSEVPPPSDWRVLAVPPAKP